MYYYRELGKAKEQKKKQKSFRNLEEKRQCKLLVRQNTHKQTDSTCNWKNGLNRHYEEVIIFRSDYGYLHVSLLAPAESESHADSFLPKLLPAHTDVKTPIQKVTRRFTSILPYLQ